MMKVTDIHKRFGKQEVLKGIDLDVAKGEVVVLLGPSGSGKTTFLRCLNFLERADQGVIQLGETTTTLHKASKKEILTHQRQTAMVFQNYALFQNKTAKENIMMPLIVTKKQSKETALRTAEALLDQVGLSERQDFYPSQLSGGQQQRIGIARALALKPDIIICDEPVSALDVSIQAQVINLLVELQKQMDLTYFFISHDLGVVYHLCDRIAVMYLGNIVELADRDALYGDTLHPYTKALISAAPTIDKEKTERIVLTGDVPSPANPPKGCKFHTRCPFVMDKCKTEVPELTEVKDNHFVACHLCNKEE